MNYYENMGVINNVTGYMSQPYVNCPPPQFVYPPVNYLQLSEENRQSAAMLAFGETLKSDLRHQEIAHKYICKENLELAKENLAEKRMEKAEEIRERREFLSYGIAEDSMGFLRKELYTESSDKIKYSKRISDACHIKATVYCSEGELETVYHFLWDTNAKGFFMLGIDVKPDDFSTLLAKNGAGLHTSREYKKNMSSDVLSYLICKAERIEVPAKYGWNKLNNGRWYFAKYGEKVLEVLRNECH